MLGRLLLKSLWRQKSRTLLVLLSVGTAATLISAFLSIAFTITERMAQEMRSFGANIILVPKAEPLEVEIAGLKYVAPEEAAYLDEPDLAKIKTIFWRHNIVSFAPFLSRVVQFQGRPVLLVGTWFEREISIPEGKRLFSFAGGSKREVATAKGTFRAGVRSLAPWWQVEGRWLREGEEGILLGSAVARALKVGVGSSIPLSYEGKLALVPVKGIVRTGGSEEDQILADLEFTQKLFSLPGKVDKIQVSALATPDNALAIRANRIKPAKLSPQDYETWYCTPYLGSIIYQLEEALPNAKGKAIRQVSEAEGAFLAKMRLTLVLIAAVALFVASLAVMATMVAAIFERRQEIGLMKALGAERSQVGFLFLLEGSVSGLLGGLLGYGAGMALARFLLARTFSMAGAGVALPLEWVILPCTLLLAVSVALLGAFFPVREAMRLDPVRTLRGIG
ncbi:MAG: ABC transporter permease [Deltaproteobacteria bacterium]|nr:ABC transporter permease [Deltaproteobacteria bacterium]